MQNEIRSAGEEPFKTRFFPRIYAVKILFNYKMLRYAVDFGKFDFAFDEGREEFEEVVGDIVCAFVDEFCIDFADLVCNRFNGDRDYSDLIFVAVLSFENGENSAFAFDCKRNGFFSHKDGFVNIAF